MLSPRKIYSSLILIFFISAGIALSSCSKKSISVTDTRIALGSYVQITIITSTDNTTKTHDIIETVYKKINILGKDFDYRDEIGSLSLFNSSQHILKKNNELLFSLIVDSISLTKLTNGYFDPTILPLVQLWCFDTDNPVLPHEAEIKDTLKLIGHNKVRVMGDRIIKPLSVKFDLSGIAKGKIVDLIRDYLRSRGYHNFLINAGGDIYVSGTTKDKIKWRIAIQDPVHEDRYSGVVEKINAAIVTSGDYEQFFIEGGVKYCHLFNPKTGYPFSDIKSVTIIADDTTFADAIATAVFSMGSKEGFSFLTRNNIQGFIIYSKDNNKIETKSTPRFW